MRGPTIIHLGTLLQIPVPTPSVQGPDNLPDMFKIGQPGYHYTGTLIPHVQTLAQNEALQAGSWHPCY